MGRPLARLVAAGWLAAVVIGVVALSAAPVAAILEPHPGNDHGVTNRGPDQQAQVVASGRQVVVVGPAGQTGCHGDSGHEQIRATLSQVSGAFGEGTLTLSCPQADQAWRLTVDAASGAPAFSDGHAQASIVYQSLVDFPPREGQQWMGEIILVDHLPSDNPVATSFKDRLGATNTATKSETNWAIVVVGAIVALAVGGLIGVAIGRRRKSVAS